MQELGAIAQLGERLLCKQEVVGSIPSGSTSGTLFVMGQSNETKASKRNCSSVENNSAPVIESSGLVRARDI